MQWGADCHRGWHAVDAWDLQVADTSSDRLLSSNVVAAVYHLLDGLCGEASRGRRLTVNKHCLGVLLGRFKGLLGRFKVLLGGS